MCLVSDKKESKTILKENLLFESISFLTYGIRDENKYLNDSKEDPK